MISLVMRKNFQNTHKVCGVALRQQTPPSYPKFENIMVYDCLRVVNPCGFAPHLRIGEAIMLDVCWGHCGAMTVSTIGI